MVFGEGLLVVHLGVDVAMVQEMDVRLLHLNGKGTMATHMCQGLVQGGNNLPMSTVFKLVLVGTLT